MTAPPRGDGIDYRRYSRQIILEEIGEAGQRRLKAARILVVGAGGLGSPALLYLAAAGVGTLGIVENDAVDVSNLHRQVLFDTAQVGVPKVDAAIAKLGALNPECRLVRHPERLGPENAETIVSGYDIVLDATDNFAARYLINDIALLLDKPLVSASVYQFCGQLAVFPGRRGPCYRCLFPSAPPAGMMPSCSESGVLGAVPGVLGTLQAAEALKLVLGIGEPLVGRLLMIDVLSMRMDSLAFEHRPDCVCHRADEAELRALVAASGPAQACELACAIDDEVSPAAVAGWLAADRRLTLVDVRRRWERDLCALPQSIWIPLDELATRVHELAAAETIVVYCHKGGRSRRAADLLRAAGATDVWNLTGGIQAWHEDVDPTLATY